MTVVPAGRRPADPQDQQGSAGSPRHATSHVGHTKPTQLDGSDGVSRRKVDRRWSGPFRSGWSREEFRTRGSGVLGVDRGAMRGTVAKVRASLGDPAPGRRKGLSAVACNLARCRPDNPQAEEAPCPI